MFRPYSYRELKGRPIPGHDWLVEGLWEKGDRVMFVGGEGDGKSTLLRQIAFKAASGLHPFLPRTLDRPVRTLLVDFENTEAQTMRKLEALGRFADPDDMLHVVFAPQGMNVLSGDGQVALNVLIHQVRPELLCVGPVYKMLEGDTSNDQVVLGFTKVFDKIRAQQKVTLVFEHHAPHQQEGYEVKRPFGSSVWKRWLEFGFYLEKNGTLTPFRGAREDDREWPDHLRRGDTWPWECGFTDVDKNWLVIREQYKGAEKRPSVRAIESHLGMNRNSVQRALTAHRREWDGMWQQPASSNGNGTKT